MEKKEFFNELVTIQSKLKAPKGQYNSFGKYKYRSAEDILEAVKPLLAETGCVLTLTDDVLLVGDRFYIKATATIINKDGNSVWNSAFAREDETKKGMDGSQITGTASSYARKYALNGLFLIDDTKDADTDEYHKQNAQSDKDAPKATAKPKTWYKADATAEEVAEMMRRCTTLDEVRDIFRAYPQFSKELAPVGIEMKSILLN